MVKKRFLRKIIATTGFLFTFLLLCLIPREKQQMKIKQELEYVDNSISKQTVFLLDQYNMLARTRVDVSKEKTEDKIKEMLEILITSSKKENKIPSGFKAILPVETKVLSVEYQDHLVKVNFSKELLDVSEKIEPKLIEAIVYTITSIPECEKVIIYVEGDILSKLPKSKLNLPATLDRSYGINKEYDLKTYKGVQSVTVYYVNEYDEKYYYVPVTKYVNDDREKIKIIIDELASGSSYNSNLMSFLNSNTKLLATEQEVDRLFLVFNEYIFSDMDTKKILEEVIYSISLSVQDNYTVKEVVFEVGNEKVCEKALRPIS